MSGLTFAKIAGHDHKISIFEKARGVSGRMSTRYADPYQFDHGAQYFTARSSEFKSFLLPYIKRGIIADWQPKVVTLMPNERPYKREWFEPHYIGIPRMNALSKAMSSEFEDQLYLKTRIKTLEFKGQAWYLLDTDDGYHGPFDLVVSTLPSEQLLDLYPSDFFRKRHIEDVKMEACFTLMLGFEKDKWTPPNWGAAVVKNSPISWIAVNSDKPERKTPPCVVVHSSNEWAEKHFDDNHGDVEHMLLDALTDISNIEVRAAAHTSLHNWRYAATTRIYDGKKPYLFDEDLKLAAIGDWFVEGRVEGAFLSGYKLAKALL